MEDRYLKITAVLTSLCGLLILWNVAAALEAEEVVISELTGEDVGKLVIVSGEVVGLKEHGEYMSIEVEKNGSIKVFGRKSFFQNLTDGDFVEVKGEVQEYLDYLEIMPQRKEDLRKVNKSES